MAVYDPANMREGIWKAYQGNPAGSTTPDTMPTLSAPFGTPGGNWQAVGATQGGVTPAGLNPPEPAVFIDSQRTSWARFAGDVETTFDFNLVETTPDRMYAVSNIGEMTTVAPGTSTNGSVTFKLTSPRRPDAAWLFEGIGGNGKPWRVFIPRGRSMISSMSPVIKGSPQTLSVQVAAIPSSDTEAVQFQQVTPQTGP